MWAAALGREADRRPAASLSTIMNIPIKGKKQTKSQRRAAKAQAAAVPAPRLIQWVEECLAENVWQLVFEYLDLASLLQARLVCSHFRTMGESPLLWMALHKREWQHALPWTYAQRSWRELRALGLARRALRVPVSTRAKTTLDDATHTLSLLNNSMLRNFDHGTVDSMRSRDPLPPCPLLPAAGATYFEVTTTSYVSVGMVALLDPRAYGFGSAAHVGWEPYSVGYHSHGPGLVYHDGRSPVEAPGAFAAWRDRRPAARDVVGCGYLPALASVFFTLNGALLGHAPAVLPADLQLAGAVSIHGLHDEVEINWGTRPFEFSVEAHVASLE
ncbi:hypothetical protein ACHHYP_10831 [Achlya hypogyna]|uniref:F-box domain-containing protein n=1 Tax=Achlya hypogyna TaxID=1202772 RepID=A0A1V9YKL4_ACHHY|nr:hypothetical protein ACHHYP_10831 [Achlya hypogyna]